VELAQEVREAALPQGQMTGPSAAPLRLQQGLRGELERVVGTNANDPRAIARTMRGTTEIDTAGDWNPQKLAILFGEDRAQQVLDASRREVRFQDTANRIAAGSDTGATQGFREAQERVEKPILGPGDTNERTLTGIGLNTVKRVAHYLSADFGKARANTFASELGQWAVASGAQRDQIVTALQAAGVRGQQISRIIGMMTSGGLIGSREAPKAALELQDRRER
jgi:hypothetical protein